MAKLFVGNLPYDTTESELGDWFRSAGLSCTSVTIACDRLTSRPRGYGVAVFRDAAPHAIVRRCNGRSFRGRTLVISELKTPASDKGYVLLTRPGAGTPPQIQR